ncbi:TonB-dependent receptor [Sphingomonas sp. AOB5]|uniref:TonB-dependent receptor n=1 Tax=Sphingomonas sp. AOB5 TaxID=3034017 RepID=UPI0023F781AA|nr:TonB-dependent receptor [Sphingomonas sp. AOB5]MDF7775535.1 TonB-dependent receptor [Sphingomonas sp. AOB5]
MKLRKTGSFLTVMLLASAPHYAFAQSTPETAAPAQDEAAEQDYGLTEITVTARRVSERQQTTPIAVTALGGEMLTQLATSDTIDLSGRAPNVQVIQTGAGAGAASVFIRGIGNNALGFNLANPVGVYVDDVYMPRLQGSLVDLLDLERVEILRGPQGTLYGRDSTVGALKYVSRAPNLNEAHFLGRAVIGNFDRRDVLLGASVPIVPGELAVKVDLSSRSQTGYMIGVNAAGVDDGQRGNGIDRQSGRVSLLWQPSAAWSINLSADISNDDSGSTIPTRISSPSNGTCAPAVAACIDRFGSPYKTGINVMPAGYAHAWGTSLRVEYDAGPVVFKSITAYRNLDSLDVIDQTRLPGAGVLLKDLKLQDQFSQELQISSNTDSRFSWVAGLVYFHEKIDHDANLYTTHNIDDTQTADSYAAFANLNYELFDGLHVEAGGRISKERRSIDRILFPIGGSAAAPLTTGSATFSESKGTYKFGIDYAITPDVMIYASHSTGYRPGSFASTYGSQVPQILLGHTGAETAINNEVGLKSEWFNRRLRVNIAAFDTKYDNMQTQLTAVPYNVTATDFKFKGVEVEMEARPTRGLSLFASGGYLDAQTLSGSNIGKRPRLTPEFQFSIGGEYRYTLPTGTELFFNINNVYTSAYSTDPSNVSSAQQKGYSLLGANVGVEFDGGKYRLAVGGKNLTDAVYFNGTSLNVSKYYGMPRTVYLELQVKL